MKVWMVVVLAVAVLAPGLLEGRKISRCELKEKLETALKLPSKVEFLRLHLVKKVICEVEKRTQLNSSMVKIIDNQPPKVVGPTIPNEKLITETGETDNELGREKRALGGIYYLGEGTKDEDYEDYEDDEEDDDDDDDDDSDEEDGSDSDEEGEDDQDGGYDDEEGGDNDNVQAGAMQLSHKKRRYRISISRKPQSYRLYGLFQLSDSRHCDSGYRRSDNRCQKNCTDFIDDDITDDVNCLLKSSAWIKLLRRRKCPEWKTMFDGCE